MQKFTEDEQAEFDDKHRIALAEIRELYQSDFERISAVIDQPNFKPTDFLKDKTKPTTEARAEAAGKAKAANAELKTRKAEANRELRLLEDRIKREARALLKERFPYPIFLYEANKVGINATGDADQNELYPNDNPPPGITETCLELYREFRRDPEKFFLQETAK